MYNIDNRWTVETLEWKNISKCKNNKQNFKFGTHFYEDIH